MQPIMIPCLITFIGGVALTVIGLHFFRNAYEEIFRQEKIILQVSIDNLQEQLKEQKAYTVYMQKSYKRDALLIFSCLLHDHDLSEMSKLYIQNEMKRIEKWHTNEKSPLAEKKV